MQVSASIRRAEPYAFMVFGVIVVTKPYEFIWFGDIHGPNPYEFTRSRATIMSHTGIAKGVGTILNCADKASPSNGHTL